MKEGRVVYFDLLNIIAIVSVIALHMNGIVHGNPMVRAWGTSLIVECICFFAVPLFIMLSGANLLNYRKKYDTKTFFKKRAKKVLIPFIFWAIFMFIWKTKTGQLSIDYHFNEIINAFFTNKEEPIYYYIWIMLGLYLTIPFLSLTISKKNKGILFLTVILYFFFNCILCNVLPLLGIDYNQSFSVQIGGGYCIYLLLGYLLSTFDVKKKYRIIIYVFAIIGLLYRYGTTFYYSKQLGYVYKDSWSGGYMSWHCFLLTIAVFLIIKNINFKKIESNEKICNVLRIMSSCSFGIYLIHLVVKYYEMNLLNWNCNSWHFRTIGIITTYFISFLIIYMMKKIPILKKVVP